MLLAATASDGEDCEVARRQRLPLYLIPRQRRRRATISLERGWLSLGRSAWQILEAARRSERVDARSEPVARTGRHVSSRLDYRLEGRPGIWLRPLEGSSALVGTAIRAGRWHTNRRRSTFGLRSCFTTRQTSSLSSAGPRPSPAAFPTTPSRTTTISGCTTRRRATSKTFAPAKLFFDPGFSVIDGTIVKNADRYVLVLRKTRGRCGRCGWHSAIRRSGPGATSRSRFTANFTEGPSVLKIGDDWLIYYDAYRDGIYGAAKTRDFKSFTDVTRKFPSPRGTNTEPCSPCREKTSNTC